MLVCPLCRLTLGDDETTCPRDGQAGVEARGLEIPADLRERFSPVQRYAEGESGSLFLVDDQQTGRRGLLKVLRLADKITPAEKGRLKRELVKQANIAHDVLGVPLATGDVGDGPWLFREWHEGVSLAVRLKRDGALPLTEAVAIAEQCASALEALHRAGLLHRDLKPGHVILSPRPSGIPKVAVVDAGIAAKIDAGTSFDVVGTPAYISPEQAKGKLVSFRSDLYALGCVLFEMITGAPPFEGEVPALLEAHASTVAPTPSVEMPGGVANLLGQLLAKEPRQRPFSAQQVRRALRPFIPEDPDAKRETTQTFDKLNEQRRAPLPGIGTLRPAPSSGSRSVPPPPPPGARKKPTSLPPPPPRPKSAAIREDHTQELTPLDLEEAEEVAPRAPRIKKTMMGMPAAQLAGGAADDPPELTQELTPLDLAQAEEVVARAPKVKRTMLGMPAQSAPPAPPSAGTVGTTPGGVASPSAPPPPPPSAAPPVTASPESASPVTASPVAASPESASPVAASPESASPVTASPESASPVTASPESASPVTGSPESASPVTASPVTASPVSASPVSAPPPAAPPSGSFAPSSPSGPPPGLFAAGAAAPAPGATTAPLGASPSAPPASGAPAGPASSPPAGPASSPPADPAATPSAPPGPGASGAFSPPASGASPLVGSSPGVAPAAAPAAVVHASSGPVATTGPTMAAPLEAPPGAAPLPGLGAPSVDPRAPTAAGSSEPPAIPFAPATPFTSPMAGSGSAAPGEEAATGRHDSVQPPRPPDSGLLEAAAEASQPAWDVSDLDYDDLAETRAYDPSGKEPGILGAIDPAQAGAQTAPALAATSAPSDVPAAQVANDAFPGAAEPVPAATIPGNRALPLIALAAVAGLCVITAVIGGGVALFWGGSEDNDMVVAADPVPTEQTGAPASAVAPAPVAPTPSVPAVVPSEPTPVEPAEPVEAEPAEQVEAEPAEPEPAAPVAAADPPPRERPRPPPRERPAPREAPPAAGNRLQQFQAARQEALSHFRARRFAQAAAAYERATRLNRRHAGSFAGLGASRLAQGRPQEAVRAYQQAVRLQPRHAGFHAALGRAHQAAGNRGAARREYQQALRLDANNRAARAGLQSVGG